MVADGADANGSWSFKSQQSGFINDWSSKSSPMHDSTLWASSLYIKKGEERKKKIKKLSVITPIFKAVNSN